MSGPTAGFQLDTSAGAKMMFWNDSTKRWEAVESGNPLPVTSSGGGGGGAVTVADGADATQGITTGTKVVTDANGTVQQYLRGLVTFFANALGAGTAAASHRVTLASDDPAVAAIGSVAGAAIITDANGTLQQYLRGLIKQWIAGTLVIGTGANTIGAVTGTVATNVAITGNPLNLGAQAVSSENAAVTTARQVQLVADLAGKLITLPYANPENFVSGAITSAMTGTTSTSLLAAPASGLRNYITQITVSNSHATVGTDIIIQDGNGGTTLYTIPAAAVYGGAVLTFPTPLRQPTTATAIFCANVTTGASTKVSASGYKGA